MKTRVVGIYLHPETEPNDLDGKRIFQLELLAPKKEVEIRFVFDEHNRSELTQLIVHNNIIPDNVKEVLHAVVVNRGLARFAFET